MQIVKKFVIQKHTRAGKVHWDLMLEADDTLQTYKLSLSPEKLLCRPTDAVKIFDHPLKFLTYEGTVNNGKGSVRITDTGTYQLLNQNSKHRQLQLDGKILKGRFTLTHIEADNWEFGPC